jgi:hypothetical protein
MAEQIGRSDETLKKVKQILDGTKSSAPVDEAAEAVEPAMKALTVLFAERGLDPEQVVFALALLTINFREQMPERIGGKEMFDRVAHEAHKYYQTNK